jgi:hypothetical protein
MKRKIIASLLGAAGLVALNTTSYGQGITFQNYSFGADALNAPVTFATSGLDGATAVTAGWGVGDTFQADLLYEFSGQTSYTLLTAANANDAGSYPTSFAFGSSGDGPVDTTSTYAGYFFGNGITIPGYTSGAVSLIVEAYNGTSYASSVTTGGEWAGQSAAFSVPSLATGTTPDGDFGAAMPAFTVAATPVPEPTTLALAGLGGAALLALRRKKA